MSDRDAIRENIQRRTPKGMKRPAPKPQAKKEPKEGRLVPTSFRPKYQAPGPERIELPDIPEDLSG
jgi:hypothetical protein